jgi:hypothetical protein
VPAVFQNPFAHAGTEALMDIHESRTTDVSVISRWDGGVTIRLARGMPRFGPIFGGLSEDQVNID